MRLMKYTLSQAAVLGSTKIQSTAKPMTTAPIASTNQRSFTPALHAMVTKIKVYTTHMPMSPHTAAMSPSIKAV